MRKIKMIKLNLTL